MCHILYISPVEGHVGCFPFGAVKNNAALNISMQVNEQLKKTTYDYMYIKCSEKATLQRQRVDWLVVTWDQGGNGITANGCEGSY